MENVTSNNKTKRYAWIPNFLTVSRIIFAIVIVCLILTNPFTPSNLIYPNLKNWTPNSLIVIFTNLLVAGILFFVASLTDLLDGWIARKYNLVSNFGKLWDPITDKILVDATLIALTGINSVVAWITIIMIIRDIIVDGSRMYSSSKGKVIPANIFGKLKTVMQMISITLILCLFEFKIPNMYDIKIHYTNWVGNGLLCVAMALSVISGVIYIYEIFFKENKNNKIDSTNNKDQTDKIKVE